MVNPNILLLAIDSLRYDHVSCCSYANKTTPNLDRLCWRGECPLITLVHYSAHWPYAPPEPFFNQFLDDSLRSHVMEVKRDVYGLMSQGNLESKIQVIQGQVRGALPRVY